MTRRGTPKHLFLNGCLGYRVVDLALNPAAKPWKPISRSSLVPSVAACIRTCFSGTNLQPDLLHPVEMLPFIDLSASGLCLNELRFALRITLRWLEIYSKWW